jgi:hypothetical protein
MDEDVRAKQMEELKAGRLETERARERVQSVLHQRNERLEARRKLVEAKRIQVAGGKEAYEEMQAKRRGAEADRFLDDLGLDMGQSIT